MYYFFSSNGEFGELQQIKMKGKTKTLETILVLILFISEIIFENCLSTSTNCMKSMEIEEYGISIKKLMLHLAELQNIHQKKYISNSSMNSIMEGLELLGDK